MSRRPRNPSSVSAAPRGGVRAGRRGAAKAEGRPPRAAGREEPVGEALVRAGRKLFAEKAPNALRETVFAALDAEAEKERTLDEEARRMMEAARQEIASGRVDGHELFRRIRRKLAEQRGIVL